MENQQEAHPQGKGKKGIVLFLGGALAAVMIATPMAVSGWRDATHQNGATLTAGDLAIEALGDPTWQDVANDTEIADISEFRVVPGDVVEATYLYDAALEGDNLKATLTVSNKAEGDLLAGTAADVDANETGVDSSGVDQDGESDKGVTLTYTVTDSAGAVVTDPSGAKLENIAVGESSAINLTAAGLGSQDLDGEADFAVKLKASFDADTPERTRADAQAVISDIDVVLEQDIS